MLGILYKILELIAGLASNLDSEVIQIMLIAIFITRPIINLHHGKIKYYFIFIFY